MIQILVLVAALMLSLPNLSSAGGSGGQANPGVLPPNSSAFGKTYGEWSAEFWKWLFSLPVDHNPVFDTANCSAGQSGHVWFLGGNVECSTIEDNGTTEAQLRDCANSAADFIRDPAAELDGVSLHNLLDYRRDSPLFTFGPLPDNNLLESFGVPHTVGHTSPSVADGVYLLLAPLSAGSHTLHFSGVTDLSSIGQPKFIQDITYHLTVRPNRP